MKNRGVKDILIICADGLTGIKEAIAVAFPKTEYQRCIVHQVRNTMKYVADKDRKPFCADMKTIYQAPTEEKALEALEQVTEKWSEKYPNSIKSWKQNRDASSSIFKFSTTVRKVIYTTNAIENLNATYRKLNRQRSAFPSDTALLKALYLSTFEATKNGPCRFETGDRFMVISSCTKGDFHNNTPKIGCFYRRENRLLLTCISICCYI